jgi:TubC N-terminal docking domain
MEPEIDTELVDEEGSEKDSVATKLIRLAEASELFHDAMRDGFATALINGHRETMRIDSKSFRQHLSLGFFKSEGKAPSPQSITSALATIEAMAIHEGSAIDVHVRIAGQGGDIWLDLCNERWEAIHFTNRGWEIIPNPPVKFVRPSGMLPLPRPSKGGSMGDIEPFTTLRGDALALVKGFLLGCMRERGPFPMLALIGEQGSGKTTLSGIVKRTVDPSKAATRCLPKDERDLMITAESQRILAFDNLSHVDEQMSDALCRLATGGGLSTRTLYTDREQVIFETEKPVILSAITDVLTKSDLLDRAIIVSVPPLDESKRRLEREFWKDFDHVHPSLLGTLCDAACLALAEVKSLEMPTVRMSDFALFVARGESKLGLKRRAFINAYEANRREANESAVDFSPVAQAVKEFLKEKTKWLGTAAELLEALTPIASDDIRRSKEWPKTPRGLSGALRKVIPNLRPGGISITLDNREPGTGRRLIEMKSRDGGCRGSMIVDLLAELESLGVEVIPQGDNLAIRPASKVPPELKERLRQHKAEVLATLKAHPQCPGLEKCVGCYSIGVVGGSERFIHPPKASEDWEAWMRRWEPKGRVQ